MFEIIVAYLKGFLFSVIDKVYNWRCQYQESEVESEVKPRKIRPFRILPRSYCKLRKCSSRCTKQNVSCEAGEFEVIEKEEKVEVEQKEVKEVVQKEVESVKDVLEDKEKTE